MEVLAAGDDHKALRRIARKLLEQAYTGDIAAIKEVADRLDGKVAQLIGGDDEAGPVRFARIERVIVQALPVEPEVRLIEHVLVTTNSFSSSRAGPATADVCTR